MSSKATRLAFALVVGLCASQCSLPHDPERTGQLVRETGVVRLGWVEGEKLTEEVDQALAALENRYGARVETQRGDSEALLADLAEGKIDLVYGTFPKDSPWAKDVHLGRALGWRAEPPPSQSVPRFAMRNGENGWIMAVERASQP